MRKNLTFFCVFALSLFLVGYAFAENNANAYFKLDKNIATAGYQEGNASVPGIGANALVGFTVYALAFDNLKGFTVKFEWDSAKAAYRSQSGPNVLIEDTTVINGESIDAADEKNPINGLLTAGETNTPGVYEISKGGSDNTVTASPALIYYALFKTASTFKTDTTLAVKVSLTISDDQGATKFLGYRFFNVGPVAVENQSWGKVKSQFKTY